MNAKASVSKELNTKHTKILEGLLKLPVNKQCADCKSKGPRWASINLGIFICLQCSGIHRSLGVHISQVRSATLDTWLPEQVAFMQKMGNEKANNYWEAELPPNYARNGIESFIHSKYKEKRWVPRDEKSTSSPPPKLEEEEEEEVSFENNLGNHATKKDLHNHPPKIPTVAPSKAECLHALDDPSGKGSLSPSRSNNGWVVFQSAKEPRSAPEKKSTAAVAKSRNKTTGSPSSLKPSTQRTAHTAGAPNDQTSFFDKHIMSAPPVPFHQQQAHPPHHQDHPEPVCVPTHKRSASDSYAMNGTITTQSWVNFDYDDPEDRSPVGQWYSSGSSQQAENSTLPHLGASDDSLPAFGPNASCESVMSANGTLGDASGVMRPRDCSSSFATNSRSVSEYDLSSLSQGLTG